MIYRVARNVEQQIFQAATTLRPPGNVPYFVDNIWEWLRPGHAPCRRRSAFASPTAELAVAAAGGKISDAWQVELVDGQPAYQIVEGAHPHDARYHEDIDQLKKYVIRRSLGQDWFNLRLAERQPEIGLFAPCLAKSDVDAIISDSKKLRADDIRDACSFWGHVKAFSGNEPPPHPTGEIFFEGPYRLSVIK